MAFMVAEKDAQAPKVATLNDLFMGLRSVHLEAEAKAVGRERLYLAACLAQYARTNPSTSPTETRDTVFAAAPLDSATPSTLKQVRSVVLAALQDHAERFAPADRGNDASLIAEALEYARGVDCRAAAKARADASRAKREAKGEGEQATTVSTANPVETLSETLTSSLAGLEAAADGGDAVALAALTAAFDRLAKRFAAGVTVSKAA